MGGSGVQRPLKFAKYLREFGWNPIILCPEPGAYQFFDDSLDNELSNLKLEIHRVKASTPFHVLGNKKKSTGLITGVIANILRRASKWIYFPDNKKGWIEPAFKEGKKIINNNSIDLIFSTAPPFSNHLIAEKLSNESGIPFVVDYRDLFNGNHFDKSETAGRISKKAKIEEQWLSKSSGVVTLDSFAQKEVERVANSVELNTKVIPHGFDSEDLNTANNSTLEYKKDKLNWLYSGLFYESNQPDTFLKALSISIEENPEIEKNVHLHFQGGLDHRIKKLIKHYRLEDIVSDYGYVSHKESVANIKKTDILWMVSNFSENLKQIKSGKLFEYIGTKKPILGLVHEGESSRLLKEYGAGFVASPNNEKEISEVICIVYQQWESSELPKPHGEFVSKFDRNKLTNDLADLFNNIVK
tara:strand:- start:7422 stop:8663 length:1242 start_codon:yes stop_codon:yes gene_type:complete